MTTLEVPETLVAALEEEANTEGLSLAEVLEAAFTHYRRVVHQRRLEASLQWYLALPEQKRKQYSGAFVAIHQNVVVDKDANRLSLYKRVRNRYGRKAVLIIPAEGPRELNVISTRIESL